MWSRCAKNILRKFTTSLVTSCVHVDVSTTIFPNSKLLSLRLYLSLICNFHLTRMSIFRLISLRHWHFRSDYNRPMHSSMSLMLRRSRGVAVNLRIIVSILRMISIGYDSAWSSVNNRRPTDSETLFLDSMEWVCIHFCDHAWALILDS